MVGAGMCAGGPKAARLRKQGYHLVGAHSAVKLCHWTKRRLTGGTPCYKETFYGIECHRCIQMSPSVDRCNLQCQFCWRHMSWQEGWVRGIDPPEVIVEGCIRAQRALLSGYGGNPHCDSRLLEGAMRPDQCAISLAGEPMMYPYLDGLLSEMGRQGLRTFLVTNGTLPERLEALERYPSQLYVSVSAPDEGVFRRLCSPFGGKGWKGILATLEMLATLPCRTVVRHTLVRGWNMRPVSGYAELDLRAEPMFIEAKGYSFVGESRSRMRAENMPAHEDVRTFAERLSEETGYRIAGEQRASRVVLLAREGVRTRFG